MRRPLRLGYLHLGPPANGIARYGRMLAGEARRRPSVDVLEYTMELTGGWREDCVSLADAGRYLAGADVIHAQYSHLPEASVWGPGWRRPVHLDAFLRHVRRPLVVTAHDTYPPEFGWRRRFPSRALALRQIARAAHLWLVSSAEERRRLLEWMPRASVDVIPHFVEERAALADRAATKRDLGLSGARVVTLLGFIHVRKGYRLLLEAVPYLPQDVVVVLAGEPIGAVGRELHDFRQQHGDRVRMTGYLSEHELETYLAATDLAVCPFQDMSASGSLATWLSAGRPVLASDLPQIAEFNRIEPEAISTFAPYTATVLAARIAALLHSGTADRTSGVLRLGERLSLRRVFGQHLPVYLTCAGRGDEISEREPLQPATDRSGAIPRPGTILPCLQKD